MILLYGGKWYTLLVLVERSTCLVILSYEPASEYEICANTDLSQYKSSLILKLKAG